MQSSIRSHPYWCSSCDVYGCGTRCWMCESTELTWSHVPRYKLPDAGVQTHADPPAASLRRTG